MKKHNYPLHIFLFLLTVFTTMMAGAELVSGRLFFHGDGGTSQLSMSEITSGWQFSFAFLLFLTVHEFGHYFMAVYHRVKCSLPYYIPIFFPFMLLNIGSFGAVIRIREMPSSRQKYFDIGVAGPLAGFVVSVGLLIWGFSHLPNAEEYISHIHPDYMRHFGGIPSMDEIRATGQVMAVGSNLMFELLKNIVPGDPSQIPPVFELMHYPFIFVGYLTLFFTALNLLPIGQLDGGHVIYGLFGQKNSGIVSRVAVFALLFIGGTGLVAIDPYSLAEFGDRGTYIGLEALKFTLYAGFVYFIIYRIFREWHVGRVAAMAAVIILIQGLINLLIPGISVNGIWLLFSFLSVSFVGVDHPSTEDDAPLDTRRKVLGWMAIIIFILCFSPSPIYIL